MDKLRKLELIQRSLGIRHKLKVHESMKSPETHEDMAVMMISKWELEDELKAIEEMLNAVREKNVAAKKNAMLNESDEERIVRSEATAKKKKLR
jgi:hypothetical protein